MQRKRPLQYDGLYPVRKKVDMDDVLIACVTDILAYLESGNTVSPTSVLHNQLKKCSRNIISDEDIKQNRCMVDIIDEEAYNLVHASEWFKTIV